jgi:ribose transport system substrate-binding protein
MKTLRVAGWLAVAALAGLLVGCKGSGKPKVAFVSNNPENFWTIAQAGAQKAADEEGVELVFRKPSQGAAEQKEIIDILLNQNVKGVAVSVIDPDNQTPYLNEIADRTNLLAVDNDAPRSKRKAYIGTDNYMAGRAAGKLVKASLKDEGGLVVIFVGDTAPLNAKQRRQGVIDELADRPIPADTTALAWTPDGKAGEHIDCGKYKVFWKTWTDQPQGSDKAYQNAVDALKDGDVKRAARVCMVGLWAYNPPQILTAVKDAARDEPGIWDRVKIVGFDEDFTTLDGVRDGQIYGTVVQQPYEFGYRSVKLLARLAKGDTSTLPPNGIDHVPYRIITKQAGLELPPSKGRDTPETKSVAVEEFRAELNKLLGK